VRLSVGARARDVAAQFFLEALLLGAVGGVAGVVLGIVASRIVSESFGWTTSLSPGVVLVSYGIAVAIGVVAGFFPARRAARLDPIEALRYE
jgi:ABC-type antimicrobial peptide transport system permease subunit